MNVAMAQEQKAIKITNPNTQKEILIKEGKRIILKTNDDKKLTGRFKLENNSILVGGELVELTDIQYIKRNPLFTSILTTGALVYGGILTVGIGTIIGLLVEPTAFLLTIPGAAMIYAGIKSPNFHKKYKADSEWTYELVSLTE